MKASTFIFTVLSLGFFSASGLDTPLFTITGDSVPAESSVKTETISSGTKVLRFEGKSFVKALDKAKLPEKFTFLTWFAPEKQSASASLICKRGWHNIMMFNEYSLLEATFCTADKKFVELRYGKKVPVQLWHLAALVYDGSEATIYLDGKAVVRKNIPGPLYAAETAYFIGAVNDDGAESKEYYQGLMNGTRVWDKALSAAEIETLYRQEKSLYSEQ